MTQRNSRIRRSMVPQQGLLLAIVILWGVGSLWEAAEAQTPPGRPTYRLNFSTDANSQGAGYSQPGYLPAFAGPGGDILGGWIGPPGTVIPPMTCSRPAVICPAGPSGMGLGFAYPAACQEIDAYSTGSDWKGKAWPWVIIFSVDRTTVGFSWPRPSPANQFSDVSGQASANEAAADMFVSGVYLRVVTRNGQKYAQIGLPAWNILGMDGDGLVTGTSVPAPAMARTALGLFEPSPPGAGDDVDGIDSAWSNIDSFRFVQDRLKSPAYPLIPVLGQGSQIVNQFYFSLSPASAAAYGCSPADILVTNRGDPPTVWATAQQLGLNPAADDIDALALFAGGPRYIPRGGLIFFSVSRTSAVVGTPDVLWGIPIMPSDILMPGDILGFPGQIAILVPGSGMGLLPFLQRPPGVVTDNLNALHGYGMPTTCGDDEDYDWIEWTEFPVCENTDWLPEEVIEEWDERELPPDVVLPEGPFDTYYLFGRRFHRGDSNGSGALDIADAICVLGYLFGPVGDPCKEQVPFCLDAADTNDDGAIDIGDAIAVLSHLFAGAVDVPEPFGECGTDPTMDALGCLEYLPCEQEG